MIKLFKRLIKFLYKRYIDELNFPEDSRFIAMCYEKNCYANTPENTLILQVYSKDSGKFFYDKYVWDGMDQNQVKIIKKK